MSEWKFTKAARKAMRRENNKPAVESSPDSQDPDASVSLSTPRDFPAGNISDMKSSSLFLHSDGGKATKAWWNDAILPKGQTV